MSWSVIMLINILRVIKLRCSLKWKPSCYSWGIKIETAQNLKYAGLSTWKPCYKIISKKETNTINEEQWKNILLYWLPSLHPQCTDEIKCWNLWFVCFLKECFSLNQTYFHSFETVFPYVVLKIDICRYTGDDPSVFFLKKWR